MPVMEGKALLFKEFEASTPGRSASRRRTRTRSSPSARRSRRASAGSTWRTSRLLAASRSRHGSTPSSTSRSSTTTSTTAIVVLAALVNALEVVGKRLEDVHRHQRRRAGVATTDALLAAGARQSSAATRGHRLPGPAWPAQGRVRAANEPRRPALLRRRGARGRRRLHRPVRARRRRAFAGWRRTRSCSRWRTRRPRSSPRRSTTSAVALTGRLRLPEPDQQRARVPGVFRGALDVRASAINADMKVAAAHAIASVIPKDELGPEYVIRASSTGTSPRAWLRRSRPQPRRRASPGIRAIARRPRRSR